jgi:hypothetical protein
MECENLKFDGKVNFADFDAVRNGQDGWREIQNAPNPRCDNLIADLLGSLRGYRDHCDVSGGRSRSKGARWLNHELLALDQKGLPDDGLIGVDQRPDLKSAGDETAVGHQRLPEVAHADDDYGPRLGGAERT